MLMASTLQPKKLKQSSVLPVPLMYVSYVPSWVSYIIMDVSFQTLRLYIAHPLNDLLKQDMRWNWSDECEGAFCKLKEQLASTSVLAHYDVNFL